MTDKDGWQRFINLCADIKTKKNLQEFFDLVFTIEEKEDVIKRIGIIDLLLKENVSQREIAKKTGTSVFKVTRGSHALKGVSPALKDLLKKEL